MVRMARYGEENRSAFIAVDLARDFVDLKFGSPGAAQILKDSDPVIPEESTCNSMHHAYIGAYTTDKQMVDSHIKNDPEFRSVSKNAS